MLNDIMSSLGSAIVLPIFIFIFALCLKVKPGTAFKSAIFIGIGLIGIGMVLDYFTVQVTDVVNNMVETTNINLPFLDVSWGVAATVAYSTSVGLLIIPFCLAVNVVVLLLKGTDTLDIDIWNYWHFALVGGLVYYASGSLVKAFFAAGMMELFALLFADWCQPATAQYYGYEGISFPTVSSVEYMPWAILINRLCDLIGLDKVKLDPENIQKKLKVFGDPAILGLVIGFVIGIAGNWGSLGEFSSWCSILGVAMAVAAVMHIFPMMPRVLMQGLVPISNGIRDTLAKKGFNRSINLGMDTALCCGETATLASSLIMVPMCIFLMIVLPYNKFLWIADLLAFPWFFALITPVTKGNILKNVIIGSSYLCIGDLIITKITPFFTEVAISAGYTVAGGVQGVNAGGEGISWLLYSLFKGACSWIGMVVIVLIYAVMLFLYKKNKAAFHRAAGYLEESGEEA